MREKVGGGERQRETERENGEGLRERARGRDRKSGRRGVTESKRCLGERCH